MLRILGTRPPSVWLAQLMLLGGAFLVFLWPIRVYLTHPETGGFMFGGFGDYVGPDQILIWSLKAFAYLSPFIVVPLIAFVGLAKRKQFGRWLSVLVLAGAFPCWLIVSMRILENTRYSPALFLAYLIAVVALLLAGSCLLLIVRLVFGEAEKKFFNS